MNRKETIYIAGPECFFENGNHLLKSMRVLAESQGHNVSLPNDDPLKLNHEDLRLNADEIFENLKKKMLETTMIVADLDQFRGAEPDSGTIYEIGMSYALDQLIYGYTRDMRPLVWKDQKLTNKDGIAYDESKMQHYYSFLPFSPLIMASTKIVEGDFADVLSKYNSDTYFGNNAINKGTVSNKTSSKKSIFILPRYYYDPKLVGAELDKLELIQESEFTIVAPYFRPYNPEESIDTWLQELITENTRRVDQCDIFVADLNDFRGYECSNDVAFLCGYAFQKGKLLYGYMNDTRPMIEKIPNHKVNGLYKDLAGRDVENFNYPINLMFSSSMKIIEGDLSDWAESFFEK